MRNENISEKMKSPQEQAGFLQSEVTNLEAAKSRTPISKQFGLYIRKITNQIKCCSKIPTNYGCLLDDPLCSDRYLVLDLFWLRHNLRFENK